VHPADLIAESIARTGSFACVGLDPRPSLLPPSLIAEHVGRHGDTAQAVASAFVEFNAGIIDAVSGRCAVVKPQVACYEAYGSAGWDALAATVDAAHSAGIPVIVDAKRGDIGSTADHYAQALFGGAPALGAGAVAGLGADWVTVNAYMGTDAITPFLAADLGDLGDPGDRCDVGDLTDLGDLGAGAVAGAGSGGGLVGGGPADGGVATEGSTSGGVFVLVRTSNPSGAQVQELRTGGADEAASTVAHDVARLVDQLGEGRDGVCGFSDVGAVVGATYPDEARRLRQLMPRALFLVPGYGAQGGTAADSVAGARPDGSGVLVSASRSIAGAWQSPGADDWRAAAAAELDRMNDDLAAALDA
jgi:orotidine-5'-phosphate decarboxylase